MLFDLFKNGSIFIRVWLISVVICAIYGLLKVILYPSLTSTDHLIMAYTHFSLLAAFFIKKGSGESAQV